MEVPLSPDLQAKVRRLAAQQGRASAALIVEAVERLMNYDEWFLREVDKGLASCRRWWARRSPGRQKDDR